MPTLKQSRFVTAYLLNGGNGRQAAEEAGYEGSPHTLAQIAHENLMKPDIQAALRTPLEGEDALREGVIRELKSFAFADVNDGMSLMAKLRALELLGKCLGMYKKAPETPERQEMERTKRMDIRDMNPQQLLVELKRISLEQRMHGVPFTPEEERKEREYDALADQLLEREGMNR